MECVPQVTEAEASHCDKLHCCNIHFLFRYAASPHPFRLAIHTDYNPAGYDQGVMSGVNNAKGIYLVPSAEPTSRC